MLLLLLQTLIGFGCSITMLYRQATLNTAFLLGRVPVSQLTNAHPVPFIHVVSLSPYPCLHAFLLNELFLSFAGQRDMLGECTAEMNQDKKKGPEYSASKRLKHAHYHKPGEDIPTRIPELAKFSDKSRLQ